MRIRVFTILALVFLAVMTFSLTRGQDSSRTNSPAPAASGAASAPRESITRGADATPLAGARLTPLQQEMLLSCRRGADWLYRMNGVKGRFLPGYLPALKMEMQGDNYLRQIGAAFALARVARFLGEERYAVRAAQAILTLLEETVVDSSDPSCRHGSLPSAVVNRLGAAGLLVLAINELPAPQADLLEKSEQLCNWIRRQARGDGSLRCNDTDDKDNPEEVNAHPGVAFYALLRSQKHRPEAWKTELARKAATYYRGWWKTHRTPDFVPWQTAACAEGYLQTKEAAFLEFVAEMNDWLCGLQYDRIDPRRLDWYGGFMGWAEGKPVDAPPTIRSALYVGSLAAARRAMRAAADVPRHQRFTEVLERGLQYVVRLQYTDANAQHFAEWYRPRLVGAFHASSQDGDLRIDYAQYALSALVAYLEEGAKE